MAVMTPAMRTEVRNAIMREWSQDRTPLPATKSELLALVGAVDDWFDANDNALVQIINATPMGSLPRRRKIRFALAILNERFGVS